MTWAGKLSWSSVSVEDTWLNNELKKSMDAIKTPSKLRFLGGSFCSRKDGADVVAPQYTTRSCSSHLVLESPLSQRLPVMAGVL